MTNQNNMRSLQVLCLEEYFKKNQEKILKNCFLAIYRPTAYCSALINTGARHILMTLCGLTRTFFILKSYFGVGVLHVLYRNK